MKKVLALILAVIMLVCVCGCNGDPDNASSDQVDIEYQHITIGPDGNEITGSVTTDTSSGDDTPDTSVNSGTPTSSDETPATSSKDPIKDPVVIDYNTTVEVDICDDVIRGYLDATTPDRQYAWLSEYSGIKYDWQAVDFDWYFDGSSMYTFTYSENADFSNASTIQTKFAKIEGTTFIPGKTYYWKVTGTLSDEVLGGGKIYVKDAPVRWISIDGTGNVRDMGGWKTASGKKVKYGMIYRGQKLESVNEDGLKTIKNLGLKTELDLRYASQKFQKEGTGMNYVFIETNTQYDRTLKNDEAVVKSSYKKIFELLSDESNYPFYAHCSAGADRTGTFAFIVNGLLGVSYEDLTRDFELTSFSSSGKRWRGMGNGGTFTEGDDVMQEDSNNTVAWGRLYKEMLNYGADNGYTNAQLSEIIEHWLTSYVGVPQSQIDSFKNIMLE